MSQVIESAESAVESPTESTVGAKRVSPLKKAMPASTKQTVAALFLSGVPATQIAQQFGLNIKTVRTWITRSKLVGAKAKVRQIKEGMPTRSAVAVSKVESLRVMDSKDSALSHKVRQQLMSELESQLNMLREEPLTYASMPTVRGSQGRTAITKTLAETAALVFPDWSDSGGGLVLVGEMSQSQDVMPKAVDIDSTVLTPQPVVVDTSIGDAIADQNQVNSSQVADAGQDSTS